ncbi:MAG: S8 family serine peptidase [Methanomicrobiales archaeon]|nr:S8 family serine peptidase [Methanomicrobiales archaeon]MDI6876487.1 S8 family serine peptidase [Methanomicrobiales archaeon]
MSTRQNEGTAMLEIVHEIAPGAELYFHEYGSDEISLLNAIYALAEAGCDVIVEDVGVPTAPYFEDGDAADMVKRLLAKNETILIAAAGNSAQRHYQGMFNASDEGTGDALLDGMYLFHEFSTGRERSPFLFIDLEPDEVAYIILQWDDRWGSPENDYDLILWDPRAEEVIERSDRTQGEALYPYPMEDIHIENSNETPVRVGVLIGNYVGRGVMQVPRNLELYIYGTSNITPEEFLVSADSIHGLAALPEVITVGALDAGTGNVEAFSSRGPVTITYPRPETRIKPDIMSYSRVQVSGVGDFPAWYYRGVFPGTSAAAPHIAGITALIWSGFPDENAGQIKERLYSAVRDLGPTGKDPVYGYGVPEFSIIPWSPNATPAVTPTGTPGQPMPNVTANLTPTANVTAVPTTNGTVTNGTAEPVPPR